MAKPTKPVMKTTTKPVAKTNSNTNRNVTFTENKWASVLNSTDPAASTIKNPTLQTY